MRRGGWGNMRGALLPLLNLSTQIMHITRHLLIELVLLLLVIGELCGNMCECLKFSTHLTEKIGHAVIFHGSIKIRHKKGKLRRNYGKNFPRKL